MARDMKALGYGLLGFGIAHVLTLNVPFVAGLGTTIGAIVAIVGAGLIFLVK